MPTARKSPAKKPAESPRKLTWEEVQTLCEEYINLHHPFMGIRYRESPGEIVWCRGGFVGSHDERKKRIREIESLVGMDAIHEYCDRKAVRLAIEEAEERCMRRVDTIRRSLFWQGISIVALLALAVGLMLHTLSTLV